MIVPAIGVIGELAVVSIAIGALFWALGQERTGKRAIVFGLVLGGVGEALERGGTDLAAWACAHRTEIGLALIGTAGIVALLRLAWSVQSGKGEAKLSKKRRVQGGP